MRGLSRRSARGGRPPRIGEPCERTTIHVRRFRHLARASPSTEIPLSPPSQYTWAPVGLCGPTGSRSRADLPRAPAGTGLRCVTDRRSRGHGPTGEIGRGEQHLTGDRNDAPGAAASPTGVRPSAVTTRRTRPVLVARRRDATFRSGHPPNRWWLTGGIRSAGPPLVRLLSLR